MRTFTTSIEGILLKSAPSFLFSIQHTCQCCLMYSQLISGKQVSYFIALVQIHCIAMKKTNAWDKTKTASSTGLLQSLILAGTDFQRPAFRDTSKRSPPWKCTCSSSTILAGQALKCRSTTPISCQESWHVGRGDAAGGRRKYMKIGCILFAEKEE